MKVIMHNSVSLDMSMKNLSVDLETHYSIVTQFKPDVYLFGSQTALEAINKPTQENLEDFKKPDKKPPYWVIVDSRGKMENHLHDFRKSNYAGPLIILISEKTPEKYVKYLEKRDYFYHKIGQNQVDYKVAFNLLEEKYNTKTIVVDSGGILNSFLIKEGLINEISLLINPNITGKNNLNLFRKFETLIQLELMKQEKVKNLLWVIYRVKY